MNKKLILLIIICILTLLGIVSFVVVDLKGVDHIYVKNGWFYVDGERFFVKAIGYSPIRPGDDHSSQVNLEQCEKDMKMIQQAGFNTIRTWSALSPEQIQIIEKYGMKIIQGIWVDMETVLKKPAYGQKLAEIISKEIQQTEEISNSVLFYLVGNEPPQGIVEEVGEQQALESLQLLYTSIKALNEDALISISDSPQLDYIDHSFWDIICFNVYPYTPVTVANVLGYKTYLEWLKKQYAQEKPFVVTEFGLSVSKTIIQPPSLRGYYKGGNSLESQEKGVIDMYRDILSVGATGLCVFEWIDEWWKQNDYFRDENTHDEDDYEEWFGIIGVEGTSEKFIEKQRPVYDALKVFQKALLITPYHLSSVSGVIKVEVYADSTIKELKYSLGDNKWNNLKQTSAHWYKAELDTQLLKDGVYELQIRGVDQFNERCAESCTVWVNNKNFVNANLLANVQIQCPKLVYKKWETILIQIKVVDHKGAPLKDTTVTVGIYLPKNWDEKKYTLITDEKGEASIKYASPKEGKLVISAGIEYNNNNNFSKRFGEVVSIDVTAN